MHKKGIYKWILILIVLSWLPTSFIWADGGYFSSSQSIAMSADQRAIIIKNGNEISMTFSTGYTGEGDDFSWIIPTPVPPLIEDVSETGENGETAFKTLADFTDPTVSIYKKGGGCFPSGTEVLTSSGPCAIETVKPGAEVYSMQTTTGEWVLQRVFKRLEHHYEGDMITITIGEDTIRATGNHPFYVLRGEGLFSRPLPQDIQREEQNSTEHSRWVEARDLQEDDVLLAKSGESVSITGVTSRYERTEVYNLEVEGQHNYTVQKNGILVHNKAGKGGETEAAYETVTVYGHVILKHYEVNILGADCASALQDWLKENGYQINPEAEELLNAYLKEGWVFVAVKLNPGEKRHYENEFLPPLTITYQSEKLIFPLRISSVSTMKTVKITLYVIADTTVISRNIPTAQLQYDDVLVKGADPEKYVETCIQETVGRYDGLGLVVLWSGRFDRSAEQKNNISQLMKTSFPEEQDVYLTRMETRMGPSSMSRDIELMRNPKPQRFSVRFFADEGYDSPPDSKEAKLIAASQAGERERVKELLEAGADVNVKGEYTWTALIWAARSGHIEVVEALLEAGADLNGPTGCTETALIAAAEHGYPTITKLLLEAGADVNGRNWNDSTALIEAILYGDSQTVQLLLESGAHVNLQNKEGRTALMEAVKRGNTGWVWMLLQNKAEVNAHDQSGRTALMDAVIPGRTDLTNILLWAGADVNASTGEDETALIMAAGDGHTEIAKILLKAGADMNVSSTRCTTLSGYMVAIDSMTALMWAVNNDHIDVVTLLLQAGADVNARGKEGATALFIAAWRNHPEVVQLLLEAGADVNAQDQFGKTALMWAGQNGQTDVVQVLLNAGAAVSIKNMFGQTALEIAEMNKHTQVIEMLRKAGAKE